MSFSLQCTTLEGTNKTGLLRADAAGYYPMCIGAFDVPNSRGDIYVADYARKLFENSQLVMRRGESGYLRGEYGHPKKEGGMSVKEYIARNHEIDERMVSHYFKKVWIDDKNVSDKDGNTIIAVMALVKPTGPYGDVLAKQLEGDENVAFSIRCFCEDVLNRRGTYDRRIRNIITWDYVNEPGLHPANKFNSPGLESFQNTLTNEHVSLKMLNDIMVEVRADPIARESESADRLEATLNAFRKGNVSMRDLNAAFRSTPKSSRW